MVATIYMVSCGNMTETPSAYNNDSWRCYAQKYCQDASNPTEDEINGYLDWYVGSSEEESDLTLL